MSKFYSDNNGNFSVSPNSNMSLTLIKRWKHFRNKRRVVRFAMKLCKINAIYHREWSTQSIIIENAEK